MIKSTLKALPCALLLGACTLAPKYEQPEVALSTHWMQESLKNPYQYEGQTAVSLSWREFFKDPSLRLLIEQALTHNHNLQNAVLNVEKARAQYNIQLSENFPVVGINGQATRNKTGMANSPTGQDAYASSHTLSAGFNNFELDFFGRVRSLSKAALNNYLQTQEAKDAAQLSVIKSVAQAYYTVRINKDLMNLAQSVLTSREKTAELARLQFEAGTINATVLYGYTNAIESAKASLASYQRAYNQALNALSVVVGVPVESLNLPEVQPLDAQFAQLRVPAGLPSQVLHMRPDVRQSEFALMAANANIGAARAALFPSISLTGNIGYISPEFSHLVKSPNEFWSITPSINLPIFNRTKLNANLKISKIEQQQAVENYKATVQAAFQEVSDALIARQTYDTQFKSTQKAAKAQAEVLRLERLRFKAGVADGMDLLDAERNYFSAQQSMLSTELALLQNIVTLYTALGGGVRDFNTANATSDNATATATATTPPPQQTVQKVTKTSKQPITDNSVNTGLFRIKQ